MTAESELLASIRLACSNGDVRLFRNQVGALEDKNGRVVRFGLAVGSHDLVGWRTITITPDMVGQRIGQFVSIEVKAPRGRVTVEQHIFFEAVRAAGGVSGVVRSVDDAIALLRG